ncbi:MAG: hypothetical protein RJA70_9 [Pseudomonadota bacterium]|jgi:hypothetical protein
MAKDWYDRAAGSYRELDTEDAQTAVEKALQLDPTREQVRLLAAQIALSQHDYPGTLKHTQGLTSAEALGLQGRAHWYAGDLTAAADTLEQLLADPQVRDPWADGVAKLARRGAGRHPFTVRGVLLAVMEMPRFKTSAMVVPVELNGQPVLAMIDTGTAEVVIDSAGGRDPSWLSLRFGQLDRRVEVKDVPAVTRDLSGISRELNAPIKLLLGTNLLRRLNPTIDALGRQFVVRTFEAPPPPVATKIDVQYVLGGGMLLRSKIGEDSSAEDFALMIDTGMSFPLVLDENAWGRTRVDLSQRQPVAGAKGLSSARLPRVQLGAFVVPDVPAVSGFPLDKLEGVLGIELDGLLGSGLLGAFRVTLVDQGRSIWIEEGPRTPRPPATSGLATPPPSPAPAAPPAG